MAEDVDVRVGERRHHAPRHLRRLHAQLRVHAGATTTSSSREQLRVLVEGAVVEDVDFDAAQDAERRQLLVQFLEHLELFAQSLGRSPLATVSRGE